MARFAYLAAAIALVACSTSRDDRADVGLRIVAWNMEHLAEADDSGCRPRTEADYQALRQFADTLEADVVAFQEVESADAAARVFDRSRYEIVIEQRAGSGSRLECRGVAGHFLNRQATGFAVRRGLAFTRSRDVVELQGGNGDLRSAVDITVRTPTGRPLRLLSVHLKSGCASGVSNDACPEFLRQAPIVESWIDDRIAGGESFLILGDFNRRLAIPDDVVWSDWSDGEPEGARLILAAGATSPGCDPRFTSFIDHFVLAERDQRRVSEFREWVYSGQRMSDHCPISIEWAGSS